MTKIYTGGVECEITKRAGQDYIMINLSSVKHYAIGHWQIEVLDGAQTYLVTVVLERKKDE